jgi:hypothetical protein
MKIPSTARLAVLILVLLTLNSIPIYGQPKSERFWVAGRYDGNRVLVYFDAVKFKGTLPSSARKLPYPVADGFFDAVELPASYVVQFQKGTGAEHFSVGDQYDLLLGNGGVATVTLTTLIGYEGDEYTGNDSFIGALATVKDRNSLLFTKNHYALKRHREPASGGPKFPPKIQTVYASLLDEPVRFNVQSRIVSVLTERMKTIENDYERHRMAGVSPAFAVQSFRLANGSLRYYARANRETEKEPIGGSNDALGAWLTSSLQTLAIETRTSPYGFESALPNLRNVVDLGGGRTGVIVSVSGEDSGSLSLVEYRDGASLREMNTLQVLSAAE